MTSYTKTTDCLPFSHHFCGLMVLILCFCTFPNRSTAQSRKPSTAHPDSILNSITNDSVYVLRAIKLSREINRHSPEETKEYELAKKAVDRALAMKDTTLYARALDNLGLLYRFHKRYDQAIPLHKRAFELIADKDVNPISKMIIADNLGVAARYNEQYDLAATYLFKALRLAEANHELRNIAIASNNLGNALSNIPEREDEAISYFKKAMDAEEKRGNDLGMAMNLLSISTYYIKKKD